MTFGNGIIKDQYITQIGRLLAGPFESQQPIELEAVARIQTPESYPQTVIYDGPFTSSYANLVRTRKLQNDIEMQRAGWQPEWRQSDVLTHAGVLPTKETPKSTHLFEINEALARRYEI